MKWIGKRTSFIDQKNKCTIVIYPDNVFWEKGLMSAWFCMWLVIGATMTWSFSLNLTRQETLIVVIFLAFWAYYATKVGRSLFWLLWGKELIKIRNGKLIYKLIPQVLVSFTSVQDTSLTLTPVDTSSINNLSDSENWFNRQFSAFVLKNILLVKV